MDHFTIFQVIGTAVSLTDVVIKSITKLKSIRTRYLLDRLASRNSQERNQYPRYQQLGLQIGNSLDNFSLLILALQQQLDRFEGVSPARMGAKKKLKFMWSEKDMSKFSILLDRQLNRQRL
ncbi:hypothetical protein PG997_011978 [Apiospora hydei]|uniref:Uncharacterized protein n=1 Tax=Apiospora hydei TaxID=1337664 RepID=A0ABR1V203_9PEZI